MYGADWCVMMRRHHKSLGFCYKVILQGKSDRQLTKGGAAGVITICVEGLCVCGRGSEMSTGRECVSLRYGALSSSVGVVISNTCALWGNMERCAYMYVEISGSWSFKKTDMCVCL